MKCMKTTTTKKHQQENYLFVHFLPHFLAIELLQRENFEECEKSCHWSSRTSLCALFHHFLMSLFSKCSDALILIMAATIHWVFTMSQVLSS